MVLSVVSETFGPSHRTWGGIVFSVFFAGGFAVLPGVAYFVRDHHKLQIAMNAATTATIFTFWYVLEHVF